MLLRHNRAFTLIELLVVVLIIGILSAIALPQYTQAVEKSRATEALSNLGSFKRAIDIWKLANPDKDWCAFTGEGGCAGQLDIAVPDGWVQGTSSMINPDAADHASYKNCSKNFCYNISVDKVSVHRANSSTYKYSIYLRFSGTPYYECHARTETDYKVCKALSDMKYIHTSF